MGQPAGADARPRRIRSAALRHLVVTITPYFGGRQRRKRGNPGSALRCSLRREAHRPAPQGRMVLAPTLSWRYGKLGRDRMVFADQGIEVEPLRRRSENLAGALRSHPRSAPEPLLGVAGIRRNLEHETTRETLVTKVSNLSLTATGSAASPDRATRNHARLGPRYAARPRPRALVLRLLFDESPPGGRACQPAAEDKLRRGDRPDLGQCSGSEASWWSMPPPFAGSGGGAMRLESHWKAPRETSASMTAAKSAAG